MSPNARPSHARDFENNRPLASTTNGTTSRHCPPGPASGSAALQYVWCFRFHAASAAYFACFHAPFAASVGAHCAVSVTSIVTRLPCA